MSPSRNFQIIGTLLIVAYIYLGLWEKRNKQLTWLDKVIILELCFLTFVYFFPPGERSSYLTSIPNQAVCFFQQTVRVLRVILSQFVQTWFTMSTWRVLSRRRRRPGHTCRSRGMAVWSWPHPTLDYTATLVKPTTGILTTCERFLNPIRQS